MDSMDRLWRHWAVRNDFDWMTVLVSAVVLFSMGGVFHRSAVAQEWPRFRAVETLRIGSYDDPSGSLTRVGSILLGGMSEIIVAQPVDRNIRVFSASGELVRVIGRRGEGPGEFQSLSLVGFKGGDTLYVVDQRLRRVTYMQIDGTVVRVENVMVTWPQQPGAALPSYLPTTPQYPLGEGGYLVVPSVPVARLSEGSVTHLPVSLVDQDGTRRRDLASVELPSNRIDVQVNGRVLRLETPFQDNDLVAVAPEGQGVVLVNRRSGLRVGSRDTASILRVNVAGDTTLLYHYVFLVEEASEDDIRAAAEAMSSAYARPGLPLSREVIRAELRESMRGTAVSPVNRLLIGQDGTVWFAVERPSATVARWHVLSSTGVQLGVFELPKRSQIHAAVLGKVVVAREDEFGVPFVEVYELHRLNEG